MRAVEPRWLTALLLPRFAACCGAGAQETQAVPSSGYAARRRRLTAGRSRVPDADGCAGGAAGVAADVRASVEPVAGPLTQTGAAAQSGRRRRRAGAAAVATIQVRTRLVNVALNVVDAHGTPVGGFEKKDFQLFEDGKPQTIAVFEREATSPLSIVLAIDSSETVLTSDRLETQAAKHFVAAILREQDELDLMDFADTVREIVPFTNQAKRVEQGLGELQHGR